MPAGGYAFRSSNGDHPTAAHCQRIQPYPSQLTSDGRWLAQQTSAPFLHTDTYQLTNGTTATPVFSFANSSAACVTPTASQTTPTPTAWWPTTIKRPLFLRRRTLRHRTGHNPRLGD
ncbi:MAG: hypothetical protein IPM76_24370 [Chloroflexi bacterium]|nr:hypothetical protein [Chloroflexota bacterium]